MGLGGRAQRCHWNKRRGHRGRRFASWVLGMAAERRPGTRGGRGEVSLPPAPAATAPASSAWGSVGRGGWEAPRLRCAARCVTAAGGLSVCPWLRARRRPAAVRAGRAGAAPGAQQGRSDRRRDLRSPKEREGRRWALADPLPRHQRQYHDVFTSSGTRRNRLAVTQPRQARNRGERNILFCSF